MGSDKGALDKLTSDLKQLRDEVELQMHLASADARDQFSELEHKWDGFRARAEVVGKASESAAEDIGEALEVLGDEIKKGYQKIRSLL
jgi:ElaB/YqjD/DUF883 family membrane-anchored ribosome-binding protein